jgi:hypothetical protein
VAAKLPEFGLYPRVEDFPTAGETMKVETHLKAGSYMPAVIRSTGTVTPFLE